MTDSAIVVIESNAVPRHDAFVVAEPLQIGAKLLTGDTRGLLDCGTLAGSDWSPTSSPLGDERTVDAYGVSKPLLTPGDLDGPLDGGLLHGPTLALLLIYVNSLARRM